MLKRAELLAQLGFTREHKYEEGGPETMQREGQAIGKGTIGSSNAYVVPNRKGSKTSMAYTIDTTAGGGHYDINGTKGVDKAFQGDSGRKYLSGINLYGPNAAYGLNSVDTEANVRDGQFVIK